MSSQPRPPHVLATASGRSAEPDAPRTRVAVIVGPTATGKSGLAIQLAEALNGEIVNADAMALYRGMDIGTAKPSRQQQHAAPHHLLDIWPIQHKACVAEYQSRARTQITDIAARGRLPILVGGSGLYVDAVLTDLRFPGTDPRIRAHWMQQVAERGLPAVAAELARRDPAAATAIDPSNARRIVRALEVIDVTGGPFAARLPPPVAYYDEIRIGLWCPTAERGERIRARVHAMIADGFVAEVSSLLEQGLAETPTASRAVGYAQIADALRGQVTMADAIERTITATQAIARRQAAWFRRNDRVHWLPVPVTDAALTLVSDWSGVR